MGKPRDFQRSKVYAAERVLRLGDGEPEVRTYPTSSNAGPGRITIFRSASANLDTWKLKPLEELNELAQKLLTTSWFREKFKTPISIKLTDGRGRNRAGCYGTISAIIKIPRWCRTDVMLLHEIAHATVWDKTQAAHGEVFCANYLFLVQKVLGEKVHQRLVDSFKKQNVRFSV